MQYITHFFSQLVLTLFKKEDSFTILLIWEQSDSYSQTLHNVIALLGR